MHTEGTYVRSDINQERQTQVREIHTEGHKHGGDKHTERSCRRSDMHM